MPSLLYDLTRTFGSYSKAQEILFLLKDVKEVVRHGFYEEQLERVEDFCAAHKLTLVKSTFKVLLADAQAYSNKGVRVPAEDSRDGMYFVYISKDDEKAYLASYYELMNDQKQLGLLLGYPECCVEFFCASFSAKNPNPQHAALNPWTNLSKRSSDCVLLSHFPCSSRCPSSITMARAFHNLIKQEDPVRADEMFTVLQEL
ncbi:DUF483 domain-containing protein [Candidatus Woesearchaeota archaeon]|nr:DUF483 domain-containing protein [Candidatus Woesearchaeota archaeon]